MKEMKEMKEYRTIFPWEDVNACMHWWNIRNLLLGKGVPCPVCGKPTKRIWFSSPGDTWNNLYGRSGILSICKDCHLQVDFHCLMMS